MAKSEREKGFIVGVAAVALSVVAANGVVLGVCFFSSSAHLSIRDWVLRIGLATNDVVVVDDDSGVVDGNVDNVGGGIGGPASLIFEIWKELPPWLTVVRVVAVVG